MNSTNLQNHPTFHQKERLVNLHSTQKRALCWSIFSHMNIKILLRFIVIATGLNAVYSVPKKVLGIRFRADPEISCRLLTKAELKKSGYDPDLQKPCIVTCFFHTGKDTIFYMKMFLITIVQYCMHYIK